MKQLGGLLSPAGFESDVSDSNGGTMPAFQSLRIISTPPSSTAVQFAIERAAACFNVPLVAENTLTHRHTLDTQTHTHMQRKGKGGQLQGVNW